MRCCNDECVGFGGKESAEVDREDGDHPHPRFSDSAPFPLKAKPLVCPERRENVCVGGGSAGSLAAPTLLAPHLEPQRGRAGELAPVSHVAILSLPRPPAPQVPPGAEAPLAPGSRRGASDTAGGSGTGTGTGTRTGAGSGAGAARPRGRWAAVWGGAGLVAMAPCKRSRRRY